MLERLRQWSGSFAIDICAYPIKSNHYHLVVRVDAQLPKILLRLNIDAIAWPNAMHRSGQVFGRALGQLDHLRLHARALGQSWVRGLRSAERLYGR